MQLETTSSESKFPYEYIGVIFIQIDQHLKSYWKNTKGPNFMEHGVQLPSLVYCLDSLENAKMAWGELK